MVLMPNLRVRFLLTLFVLLQLFAPVSVYAAMIGGNHSCAQLLVLFARGSGQNGNTPYIDNVIGDAAIDTNTEEKETAKFFDSIHTKINPGLRVEYRSLHDFAGRYNNYGYKAVSATTSNLLSAPQHRKDVASRYYESVKDGAEELAWYLEDELTSCPLQQVVLGGYSQGAEVVGDGLNILQPRFRPRIAYVALYGDPKFNPMQSLVPPKSGWWKRGNTATLTHGVLNARNPYIADGITDEGSWCASGDAICDAGVVADSNSTWTFISTLFKNPVHSDAYTNIWIPKSAAEIVWALKARLPHIADNVGTDVFINKDDKSWKMDLAVVIDVSHSMSKSLQAIKGNVIGLTTSLVGSYWQSRVAVVAYDTNFGDTPNAYARVMTGFTNNASDIRSALQSLAVRGDDDTRAMYSGLMTAMNGLDWRLGAQKKIIVITDAAANNPSPDGWTQGQVQQRAFALDPVVLNLADVSCDEAWTCNPEVDTSFQPLATDSGGIITSVYPANGTDDLTTLLADMELQPVAGITGDQSGYVGVPLQLSGDVSYDPDAALATYRWDCNNDGIWDSESSNPNAECSYSIPYRGLVVLQVVSEDGGSATATTPINIISGQAPNGAVPSAPRAGLTYKNNGVLLAWDNIYSSSTTVRVTDVAGNLIGYAPGDAQGVLLGTLGSAMTGLFVAAGNEWGWSNDTELALSNDHLSAIVPDDSSSTFSVIPAAGATTPPTPAITNSATAAVIAPAVLATSEDRAVTEPSTAPIAPAQVKGMTITQRANTPNSENNNRRSTIAFVAICVAAFGAGLYFMRRIYLNRQR